ncbi:MAG: RNA methyltransferase [Bdellovibrionales bacterium]|nr:RNA methyltransferase [Bdellovibrionales bacterium]
MSFKKDSEWIWGLHSVEGALKHCPELVAEIVCDDTLADAHERQLAPLLKQSGLKIQRQKKLPASLSEKRTQGLAAMLKHFPITLFKDFEDEFVAGLREPGQWAVLDSLQDPRNYGAVLRSAAAFGVRAVITGQRDQSPLTGVVAQASAGTVFHVRIVQAQNLSRVLERAKLEGAHIFALDADGKALPEKIKATQGHARVWVLGSEGEGVRPGLKAQVTETIRIPMEAGVESLNASVAASLAFFSAYSNP